MKLTDNARVEHARWVVDYFPQPIQTEDLGSLSSGGSSGWANPCERMQG